MWMAPKIIRYPLKVIWGSRITNVSKYRDSSLWMAPCINLCHMWMAPKVVRCPLMVIWDSRITNVSKYRGLCPEGIMPSDCMPQGDMPFDRMP